MKLHGWHGIALVSVFGLLSPVLFGLEFRFIETAVAQSSIVVIACVCFGLQLVTVGVLAAIVAKFVKPFGMHQAAIFTLVALIATRVQQLIFPVNRDMAIIEAATLLGACLLIFGFILLGSRSAGET